MNSNELTRRSSKMPSLFGDMFSDYDRFFNRLFEEFESRWPTFEPTGQLLKGVGRDYPKTDISEDAKAYYIDLAVPGWSKEEVKLSIQEDVLTVMGTHIEKQEVKDESRKYIDRKIGQRNFSRSFKLPKNLDLGNVDATQKDGMLSIVLPKKEPDQPKQIDIEIK